MASNPYANKVELNGIIRLDLTSDTVTPDKVIQGMTFHDKSGTPQTGTLEPAEPLTQAQVDAIYALL